MALENLDTLAVSKMAGRVESVLRFLRDLQDKMLESQLRNIELNTGNFDLYMTEVEKWRESAEGRAKKVFLAEERKRDRVRKAKERARQRLELEENRKKSR